MIKVELLTYTPNPEKICAGAAKLCYYDSSIDVMLDNLTDDKVTELLNMLLSMGHESPIEHICFTFGIEGVSRSLLAQLTRHRIASYSVKSQRYVKDDNFEFIIPPEIKSIPTARKIFLKAMENDQKVYEKITNILYEKHYKNLLLQGLNERQSELTATKMAIEDARFVLPNACETKLICTMNARALLHFFSQRCCNRAQWEIRELAEKMLVKVKNIAPTIFKNAGPDCLKGTCSEGKMSCKKAKEVKEYYGKTNSN